MITETRQQLLTVAEVAEWLKVSQGWVRHHANGTRRPYIRSVKLGTARRFRRQDVEELLRLCEQFAEEVA